MSTSDETQKRLNIKVSEASVMQSDQRNLSKGISNTKTTSGSFDYLTPVNVGDDETQGSQGGFIEKSGSTSACDDFSFNFDSVIPPPSKEIEDSGQKKKMLIARVVWLGIGILLLIVFGFSTWINYGVKKQISEAIERQNQRQTQSWLYSVEAENIFQIKSVFSEAEASLSRLVEDVKHAEMEGLTLSSVEDIWKLRFQIFQATLAAAAGGASLSLQSGAFVAILQDPVNSTEYTLVFTNKTEPGRGTLYSCLFTYSPDKGEWPAVVISPNPHFDFTSFVTSTQENFDVHERVWYKVGLERSFERPLRNMGWTGSFNTNVATRWQTQVNYVLRGVGEEFRGLATVGLPLKFVSTNLAATMRNIDGNMNPDAALSDGDHPSTSRLVIVHKNTGNLLTSSLPNSAGLGEPCSENEDELTATVCQIYETDNVCRGHTTSNIKKLRKNMFSFCLNMEQSWVLLAVLPTFSRFNLQEGFAIFSAIACFLLVVVGTVVLAQQLRMEKKIIRMVADLRGHIHLLQKARERTITAISDKTNFISYIFHEIRVPLNVVTLGISLLESTFQDSIAERNPHETTGQRELIAEEAREDFVSMHDQLALVRKILDDSLTLNKILSGRFSTEMAWFRVADLFTNLATCGNTMLQARNSSSSGGLNSAPDSPLLLRMHVSQSVPGALWGDFTRLQQVMYNLLSNAFKFTVKGTITVSAVLHKCKIHKRSCVRFSVEDSGAGIASEQLPKLFQPYVQIDAGRLQKHGGTGLGLAICQLLVNKHHSKVQVESTLGKGSTFFFCLDPSTGDAPAPEYRVHDSKLNSFRNKDNEQGSVTIHASPERKTLGVRGEVKMKANFAAAPEPQPPKIPLVLTSKTLLVVEDNLINQKIFARTMSRLGFDVDTASSGEIGVSMVKQKLAESLQKMSETDYAGPESDMQKRAMQQFGYAAIIMDRRMPGIGGGECTRLIREELHLGRADLPIIGCTGDADQASHEDFLRLGCNLVLHKPTTAAVLKQALSQFLEL